MKVVVGEHRDRLVRFAVEDLEAALAALGRQIVVTDPGERTDDLVRGMIEVLTSMCAWLYGLRGARNRAAFRSCFDSGCRQWPGRLAGHPGRLTG